MKTRKYFDTRLFSEFTLEDLHNDTNVIIRELGAMIWLSGWKINHDTEMRNAGLSKFEISLCNTQ